MKHEGMIYERTDSGLRSSCCFCLCFLILKNWIFSLATVPDCDQFRQALNAFYCI